MWEDTPVYAAKGALVDAVAYQGTSCGIKKGKGSNSLETWMLECVGAVREILGKGSLARRSAVFTRMCKVL